MALPREHHQAGRRAALPYPRRIGRYLDKLPSARDAEKARGAQKATDNLYSHGLGLFQNPFLPSVKLEKKERIQK
jgi:hypothetical protein